MKNLIERIEARLDDWGAKLEKKNIEYPVDLICGILFLVIGIVLLLIMPQQVQISEKDVVNGRAFPTMLIWLMLAMSALLVGREAYNMVMHRPTKTKTLNLLVETKSTRHRPHSGGHLSAGRGHGSVCCGRCILRTGISGLFPLQETPLLCHHSFNGCVDLGRIPLCAEC